jgi:hypothetical protein
MHGSYVQKVFAYYTMQNKVIHLKEEKKKRKESNP